MRILIQILLFYFYSISFGQDHYFLIFNEHNFPKANKYDNKKYKNKESLIKDVEKLRAKHIKKGHVLASIDSIEWTENKGVAHYYLGPKFDKIRIQVYDDYNYLLRKIPRVSEKHLLNTPFSPKDVAELLFGLTDYLQNNGYPFAKVWLDVNSLDPKSAQATLHIEKGEEVKLEEVFLKGEVEVSEKFLTNFIAVKEGDLYDESRMRKISTRIDQIQFIDEIKPHEILFTPEGAELYLYLKSNPVSLVNGVVGIQPDPVTGDNIITGDVRLKLQNILNRGELLDINWRSLQPQTQDLKMHANYPFLFDTPFGSDFKFDLYRRDSTFLTTIVDIGAQYFMRGGNYLKVFFEAENSNLLSGAENSSMANSKFSSVSSNRYGIGVYRRQLDYLPNPSKGIFVELDLAAGRRSSRRPGADSSNVSTTYSARLDLEWFVPLARRHVLRLANRTRVYYAPEIFTNELYRFGGLNTQRGFDEEELFASTLTTFSLEYRFLVDKDSHAFLFYDQSIYENNSDGYYKDTPFGVGAGFSFGTNIGIFSISYGIGKQFDNPMLLRNGKVHFGYVSFF